ncbi:unnamed protein product, partial [Ectocarpus sp. 6 AP-2014]
MNRKSSPGGDEEEEKASPHGRRRGLPHPSHTVSLLLDGQVQHPPSPNTIISQKSVVVRTWVTSSPPHSSLHLTFPLLLLALSPLVKLSPHHALLHGEVAPEPLALLLPLLLLLLLLEEEEEEVKGRPWGDTYGGVGPEVPWLP